MRKEYQRLWTKLGIPDSHPNKKANKAIAPKFDVWLELIPAIRTIGAKYAVIGNENAGNDPNWYEAPKVNAELTPLSCVAPLQLLAYYLALAKGTNPDSYRLDDARFEAASAFMKLQPKALGTDRVIVQLR